MDELKEIRVLERRVNEVRAYIRRLESEGAVLECEGEETIELHDRISAFKNTLLNLEDVLAQELEKFELLHRRSA
jgi:hypothetical protein